MSIADTLAIRWKLPLAFCALVLSGCANQVAAPESAAQEAANVPATGKDGVQQKLRIDNALAEAEAAEYARMNPVPIVFDVFSVKLDDNGRNILELIRERARQASRLIVTGYCDRHQIGNANAAALARAKAVRDELVQLGVPEKNIRIRHLTNAPGKHAADIEF